MTVGFSNLAGIRQISDDMSFSILDSDWPALSGDRISLVIDGVQVGSYPITKRVDDKGVYRSILATFPKFEWQHVISFFRTDKTVRFVTAASTFTLNGASGSLLNMQNCMMESANLQPG